MRFHAQHLFRKRERDLPIVCQDGGVRHADIDLTDARPYTPGEQVELRFPSTLPVRHPGWLRADIEADGDLVTIWARHEVFAHDGRTLIERGQVFEVERGCIFTVWP